MAVRHGEQKHSYHIFNVLFFGNSVKTKT